MLQASLLASGPLGDPMPMLLGSVPMPSLLGRGLFGPGLGVGVGVGDDASDPLSWLTSTVNAVANTASQATTSLLTPPAASTPWYKSTPAIVAGGTLAAIGVGALLFFAL